MALIGRRYLMILFFVLVGCNGGRKDHPSDSGADSETGSETADDSDTDRATDTGEIATETGSPSATDTDSIGATDTERESDRESESIEETDTGTATNSDSDSTVDAGIVGDAGRDTGTVVDTETGTITDKVTDEDSQSDAGYQDGDGGMVVFDADADGVPDDADNCPVTRNPDQTDLNTNGKGDVCEGIGEFEPSFELTAYHPEEASQGVTLLSVMGGLTTFTDPDYENFGYLAAIPMAANGTEANEIIPLFVYADFSTGPYSDVELMANGHILTIGGQDGGNALHEIDPVSGDTLSTYNDVMVNHAFEQLPDGHLIFIHSQHVHHNTYGIDVDDDGINEIRADSVRIIDRDGETVWDWSLYDHDPDAPPSAIYSYITDLWSNCNAVSFVPDEGWTQGEPLAGAVYLNCRLLNRLYKIDYPSEDIEWVMGSGGDFGEGFFYHSHDPSISFVVDESGHRTATRILLYDNHEAPPLGEVEVCPLDETCPEDIEPFSRVMEVEVDNGLNASIIWKWPSPASPDFEAVRFYSPLAGGVTRLPNGNLLITNATQGGNPYLGEIPHGRIIELKRDGTPSGGEIVWDARLNDAYATFKAIRIESDAIDGWESHVVW